MMSNANPSTHTTNQATRNIARYSLIALAGFNGLIALALGLWIMGDSAAAYEAFDVTYSSEMASIAQASGGLLVLIASLSFVSILWLLRGKREGILVPAAYGTFMFILGFMDFANTGDLDIVVVDSTRGFLAMLAAFFAYREMTS